MHELADNLADPEQAQLNLVYKNLIVLVAWLALWIVSMQMSAAPYESVWFPSASVTFVAFLVWGIAVFPAIFVAVILSGLFASAIFAGDYSIKILVSSTLTYAITHTLGYGLSVLAFRYTLEKIVQKYANTSYIWLLLFCVFSFLAALLTSILDVSWYVWHGYFNLWASFENIMAWFFEDFVGLIVLSPIFLAVLRLFIPSLKYQIFTINYTPTVTDKNAVFSKFILEIFCLVGLLTLIWKYDNLLTALALFLIIIPHLYICRTESIVMAPLSLIIIVYIASLFIDNNSLLTYEIVYQVSFILISIATWGVVSKRIDDATAASASK